LVIDDFEVEGTETVELTLQPPACIQIFPPPPDCYLTGPSHRAMAKILDNDLMPAPIVTIVATDPDASESGPNTGRFTVSRTGDTSNSLPVFYAIGGTAQSGIDYLTFSNFEPFFNAFGLTNVVIPAGANSTDITVTPIDDHLAESSETVVPQLQAQPWAPYLVGAPSNAVVTIADNEVGGTNHPPFVQLNAPRNGDVFIAPATIALMAYAQDAEDGYHLQVEFFEGTNSLGFGTFEATTCPDPYCPFYALTWSNVPPGEYILRAKASDSAGASSVSAAAHITVFGGVNIYATDPDASEISSAPNIDPPSDAAIFTVRRFGETNMGIVVYYEVSGTASNGVDYSGLPGEVTIPAGASSAQIVVRPTNDNLVEGTETVVLTLLPPCPQCLFVNPPCLPPQGTNCYPIGPDNKAVAYIHDDDTGSNLPPVVRMVHPGDGETFQAHSDIQLVAFAQDTEDSYFVQVEFFEGARSLGLGTFNPTRCATDCPNYVLTWSNVPAGQYVVRAKATDSQGAMSFSHSVRISVTGTNVPPGTNAPVVTIVASDAIAVEGPFCRSNWWWTTSWNGNDWTIIRGSRDPNSLAWRTNHCSDTNTATFMVRRSGPTNAELTVYYAIGGTASNGVDYVALLGAHHSGWPSLGARRSDLHRGFSPEHIETVLLGLQPPPVMRTSASYVSDLQSGGGPYPR
jgi:hypothetical protein